MEYLHVPYGIAHLSVWTVTFGQKSNPNFNVGSIQAEAGYPYLSENFRALASDQEKNYSLAFSYVELTLKGCCGKTNFDAAPYDVGVLIDLMNTLLRVQR